MTLGFVPYLYPIGIEFVHFFYFCTTIDKKNKREILARILLRLFIAIFSYYVDTKKVFHNCQTNVSLCEEIPFDMMPYFLTHCQ